MINADDFGRSADVNDAIAECFASGRISSCTLMANQPATDAAITLARRAGFADRVGVHLCLTLGPPLAPQPGAAPPMPLAYAERRLFASRAVVRAVTREFRAQVQRIVEGGITPTHIDSHQHIINGIPYTIAALRVAREFGIARMRIARNLFYRRSPAKTAFKAAYNTLVRTAGMRTAEWFTDVKPFFEHWRKTGKLHHGTIELMTHPGAALDPAVHGVAAESTLLLSPEFERLLRQVSLIGYAEV